MIKKNRYHADRKKRERILRAQLGAAAKSATSVSFLKQTTCVLWRSPPAPENPIIQRGPPASEILLIDLTEENTVPQIAIVRVHRSGTSGLDRQCCA